MAAVAAVTQEIADEAVKLIKVEYEEIPAVFDLEEAFSEDCPVRIHEDLYQYEKEDIPGLDYRFAEGHDNVIIHRKVRRGNAEEAFEKADLVYEGEYIMPRAHHCTMEPHSCVVKPESDGGLTVWAPGSIRWNWRPERKPESGKDGRKSD